MALQSGVRVGAYEVVAAIGAGGMGDVYRARDLKLGRDVALKVLNDRAGDPDAGASAGRTGGEEGRRVAGACGECAEHPAECVQYWVAERPHGDA
jgi:serine/threonine protein kinase